MTIVAVNHDRTWLTIRHSDGTSSRLLGTWLRDNIGSGRHRVGGQRTFDINELPPVEVADVSHTPGSVIVSFSPEGLKEEFDETWLRDHAVQDHHDTPPPTLWDSSREGSIEFVDFGRITGDPSALRDWLVQVRDLGFGLLENVPPVPDTVFAVVDLFGYVRETNYGRLFDVRVEPDPANLAFTSSRIGMHTDNPYRNPVPGLQLLHCLINESDGGESLLCDGFAAAEHLREDDPEAFELLSTQAVTFRYIEGGLADLEAHVPLIEIDTRGEITGVRYNSRSVQAFRMPTSIIADYYRAYRVFGRALQDSEASIGFRLDSGKLMMFDNQRVLHGRSGYRRGRRHLQGCYADKDALRSRIRVLESAA